MPVTIGTLTSRVNVSDAAAPAADDFMEKIIRAAVARMKQELAYEEQLRDEREVHDRASEPDRY